MSNDIKFNVIIPTRERAETLFYCLKTVVAQNYDNLKIFVSDNASADNTEEVVKSFHDPRIQYINTNKRISMSHNWEFALSHIDQGYVTFLGDDDGLLPGVIEKLAYILKNSPFEAINSPYCLYHWPHKEIKQLPLAAIPLGEGTKIVKSKKILRKVLRGYANYTQLPWIYSGGFATIASINKARNSKGCFFSSYCPDVYSGVALSCVIDSFLYTNTPLAVAGVSKYSHGASGFGESSTSKPLEMFLSEDNIPVNPCLGDDMLETASIPLTVYDSYLQATHLHKNSMHINIDSQLTLALAKANKNYVKTRNYCKKIAEINNIPFVDIDKNIARKRFILTTYRILKRLWNWRNSIGIDTSYFEIKNVYEVSILINNILIFLKRYGGRNIVCIYYVFTLLKNFLFSTQTNHK